MEMFSSMSISRYDAVGGAVRALSPCGEGRIGKVLWSELGVVLLAVLAEG